MIEIGVLDSLICIIGWGGGGGALRGDGNQRSRSFLKLASGPERGTGGMLHRMMETGILDSLTQMFHFKTNTEAVCTDTAPPNFSPISRVLLGP